MQAFLEGVAGFGILLFLIWITWKWGIRPLRPPKINESFDYHHLPEYRARIDAHLAHITSAPQPTPYLVQIAQAVREKLPSASVEESPKLAPVVVEEQVGSEIDNLAVKDPKAYLERMLGCLDRVYDAKDKNDKPVREKLAREKLVDTGLLTQSEWDYLIGPEVAGTKQPGILRELGMVHNHALPESRIEVKHYFMMGYLGWYGYDIPGLIDAIKAIDPSVIEQWEEWKSKGK